MVETRSGRRFAVFFFVAAFLVFFLGRWLAPVNHVALAAAAPFEAAVSAITNSIGNGVSSVFDGPRLRGENERLKHDLGVVVTRNIALQQARHENDMLRRMLKFSEANTQMDLLASRVIATDANGLSPVIFINKGRRDGLRIGMTVVDHHGYFVGSISDITANASKVQLMLSPSSSVGAMDLQTHARGLIEGKFASEPKLDNVVTSAVLHKGDLIVTSGDWNLYPRTILLGQVVGVHHNNVEPFQTADIETAADFRDLEIVQVVRSFVPSKPNQLVRNP